jgi:serine phosphatase RsbU (regulator of sigma subunit)/HAMP domain-containing protein
MAFRYTISRKIGIGFGASIISVFIVFIFSVSNFQSGDRAIKSGQTRFTKIENVYQPSEELLNRLIYQIEQSKGRASQWVNDPSTDEAKFKTEFRDLIYNEIPKTRAELGAMMEQWEDSTEQNSLIMAFDKINDLFDYYEEIMVMLSDLEAYNNPSYVLILRIYVSNEGEVEVKANDAINLLKEILESQQKRTEDATTDFKEDMAEVSDNFENGIRIITALGIALGVGGLLVAILTIRSIVVPVRLLREMLKSMGIGDLPEKVVKVKNDEIGDMAKSMNDLVDALRRTSDFAAEVGKSNFDYPHEPLSDKDTLGKALLQMRDELAETERILEDKVEERTREIEKQKQRVEELYLDVTDSIKYAKRLQDSILPPETRIASLLKDSFVLFKPKDIVSGDFYWLEESGGKTLFAAVDCTGHGVPGAFMSLIGSNGLNHAVKEHGKHTPAEILDDLNETSSGTFNRDENENTVSDGMDIALCSLTKDRKKLEYSGANNPLYLVRGGKIIKYKADKFAIGSFKNGEKKYSNTEIDLQKGDVVYIFSDGYADQFGGSKGKKFLYSNFRDLLIEIHQKPIEEQKTLLNQRIEEWKGNYEQVDDILVFGVKI